MKRLIIVPQYPTKLRYQEWWWNELPKEMFNYFDDIIVLGNSIEKDNDVLEKNFSTIGFAVELELEQVREYMHLKLQEDDVLLLNDLSFPGLFANILFHKKPNKCFAICHATSKNTLDYYQQIREVKYPVEKGMSALFDKIIVGSKYHKEKLGWTDISVLPLPIMPATKQRALNKTHFIVSVGRKVPQKRNLILERIVENLFGVKIESPNASSWEEYHQFLSESTIMLITSKEETFGYQVLDAIANGCIPLAPNKFSYPELLPKEYLYDSEEDLFALIERVIQGTLKPLEEPLTNERSKDFYRNLAQLMR